MEHARLHRWPEKALAEMASRLWAPEDLAASLDVPTSCVTRWIADGVLEAIKIEGALRLTQETAVRAIRVAGRAEAWEALGRPLVDDDSEHTKHLLFEAIA